MFEPEYRDLAFIPRWSTTKVNHRQCVAEHSFYVALYCDQIATRIDWRSHHASARYLLMRMALYHDVDEALTGDIIGPAKRLMEPSPGWPDRLREMAEERMPGYAEVNRIAATEEWAPIAAEARRIIKIADLVDESMYIMVERGMGNRVGFDPTRVSHVHQRLRDALDNTPFSEYVPVCSRKKFCAEVMSMCTNPNFYSRPIVG